MKMDEYRNIADVDLKLNLDEIDRKSVELPLIQGKWLKFFSDEALILKELKIRQREILRDRWLYYSGKADPDVYRDEPLDLKILKTDMDIFLDSDKKVTDIQRRVELQQEKVNYIENVLKTLNNMQWNIRNAIEYLKFSHGQ